MRLDGSLVFVEPPLGTRVRQHRSETGLPSIVGCCTGEAANLFDRHEDVV